VIFFSPQPSPKEREPIIESVNIENYCCYLLFYFSPDVREKHFGDFSSPKFLE
jgi:hypothetical protein